MFILVKNFTVGPIADSMGTYLKAMFKSDERSFVYGVHGKCFMTIVPGPVAVRLQQPRSARTQSPITTKLYGTNGKPVFRIYQWSAFHPAVKQIPVSAVDHHVKANTKFSV